MVFNPFANKLQFQPFTLESSPCPKCGCDKVLIAPTINTHAASSRCHNPKCKRFFRWLGKWELQDLVAQHHASKLPVQQPVAEGNIQQAEGTTTPVSLDNQQSEAAGEPWDH
jgi:hypothetical protein